MSDQPPLLGHLFGAATVAASNRRGGTRPGAWLALLPDGGVGRILVVGPAGRATLAGLEGRAAAVHVVPTIEAALGSGAFAADVAWIRDGVVDATRFAALVGAGALAPDGVVVGDDRPVAPGAGAAHAPVDRDAGRPGEDAGNPVGRLVLRARPPVGEPRSAVSEPTADAGEAMLARMGLLPPPLDPPRRVPRRLAGPLNRARTAILRTGGRLPRRRLVVLGPADRVGPGVPAWIRDMAGAAGLDLDGWTWAYAAPGGYNTRKVLLVLVPAGAIRPAIVVKLTRDPSVNRRLDNAARGLQSVAALGPPHDGRVPPLRFAGRLGPLAVAAEGAIDGPDLVSAGAGSLDDPRATDVVDWLADLAVDGRDRRPGTELAAAAGELVDRFAALYRPSAEVLGALRNDIAVIAAADAPIPVTRLHGDPGAHNLVAGPAGIVALDWENFEAAGPPLWDAAAFLRSWLGAGTHRRGLVRRSTAINRRTINELARGGVLNAHLARYCARVGLPTRLTVPLLHLGWTYEAVKEAPRLAPERMDRGVNLELIQAGVRPDIIAAHERAVNRASMPTTTGTAS